MTEVEAWRELPGGEIEFDEAAADGGLSRAVGIDAVRFDHRRLATSGALDQHTFTV